MDPITQQTVLAAAGAGGKDPLYVDDVFSTNLWNGNYDTTRSAIAINVGFDLDGEGGLVWTKNRNYGNHHQLYDTERNAGNVLYTSLSNGQGSNSVFNSFNSNGFSLTAGTSGTDALNGDAADTYVAWSFRKSPGFFDCVKYTGTGSAQALNHNLGSVPGMIIVKNFTIGSNWIAYHRSTGATKKLELNEQGGATSNSGAWNDTEPTASVFTVGANNSQTDGSGNGYEYVAYIFAHDDAQFGTDEDESIIKCGTYAGTNTGGYQDVNVGFEPQFVLIKRSNGGSNWHMIDAMRGAADNGEDQALLAANQNDYENDENSNN